MMLLHKKNAYSVYNASFFFKPECQDSPDKNKLVPKGLVLLMLPAKWNGGFVYSAADGRQSQLTTRQMDSITPTSQERGHKELNLLSQIN